MFFGRTLLQLGSDSNSHEIRAALHFQIIDRERAGESVMAREGNWRLALPSGSGFCI
jgi:hypothetical protein